MASEAFEILPVEMLTKILQSLSTPRDLASLIRASPGCFRTYIARPVPVISAILKTAIHPRVLHHALAVFYAPERDLLTPQLRSAYLDRYFLTEGAGAESFALPRDKATLQTLWKLHSRTTYFLDDYTSKAADLLNDKPFRAHLRPGTFAKPLSDKEHKRLQRAFYRHELYCRIFPVKCRCFFPNTGSYVSAADQSALFLTKLEPWEIEEMSCVHYYFTTVTQDMVDDLQDQLVGAALAAPGVQRSSKQVHYPYDDLRYATWRSSDTEYIPIGDVTLERSDDEMTVFRQLHYMDLGMYAKEEGERAERFLTYVASRGSSFVYRLVSANSDQRKAIIRAGGPAPYTGDFLPDAVREIRNQHLSAIGMFTDRLNATSEIEPDIEALARSLNKLARYDTYLQLDYLRVIGAPLRAIALCFWDLERLKNTGITASLKLAVESHQETGQRFALYKRKSAEEQLEGVSLPWSEVRRLKEEFGTTDDWDKDLCSNFIAQ